MRLHYWQRKFPPSGTHLSMFSHTNYSLNFRKPSTTNRGPKARILCPGIENRVINIARRHYHENLNEVQIEAGAFTVQSVTRDAREQHQPQFTEAM